MAVLHLTEGAFDKAVSQGVTLVDFWADWQARICKVDVTAEGALASRFGIMNIPAVLIFQDGELREQMIGLQPEDAYTAKLDALLN